MRLLRSQRLTIAMVLALSLPSSRAASQARDGDPVLIQSSRIDVVIDAPAVRDPSAAATRIGTLMGGCGRSLRVGAADSAAVLAARPPAFASADPLPATAVVFSILHTEGLQANCGDRLLQNTLLAVSGLRVTFDTGYAADRDLARVVMRRGERELAPLATLRQSVQRLGPGGFAEARMHWIRIAIDLRALEPAMDGVVDDLSVEVHTVAGGEPERLAIPWSALRRTWESMLALRIPAGVTASATIAFAEPGDEELHRAHEAYVQNDLANAVRLGSRRLGHAQLSAPDRRTGRGEVAFALAALGDTAAARVVLSRLVEEEPCLDLDPSVPSAARELFGAIRRPTARCTAQSMPRTALRAAVLPGFGRPGSRGTRATRIGIASLIGLSAVSAASSASLGSSKYERYLGAQVGPDPDDVGRDADRLFAQAESARKQAILLWTVAAATWGGQLVTTVWLERRHAERLRELTGYGAAPRPRQVGLRPLLSPRTAGLYLTLQW